MSPLTYFEAVFVRGEWRGVRAFENWESSCKERREGLSNCSPFSVSVIAIEIISSVFYYCPRVLSTSIRAINLGLMALKKMERQIEVMEEQMVGVHREMMSIKGDLQRMGALAVKVDSMLEKLPMLERMEKMLQKWENSEKGSYSKETRSGLVTATLEEGSSRTKSLP